MLLRHSSHWRHLSSHQIKITHLKYQYREQHNIPSPITPPSHEQQQTQGSFASKQTHTDLHTRTRTDPPPGQGPMGVCTEIGHLSHMMSRGWGCIIDEPKQHVSVSTHHTARHRRKQQEVGREGMRTLQEGDAGKS